jgi:hypothetical protein
MEFNKILKKIQKKQRMLLKLLVSGAIETDPHRRLEKIAFGLRKLGIVDETVLSLTSKGREFVASFGEIIFQEIQLDDRAILDKLLQRAVISSDPKDQKS